MPTKSTGAKTSTPVRTGYSAPLNNRPAFGQPERGRFGAMPQRQPSYSPPISTNTPPDPRIEMETGGPHPVDGIPPDTTQPIDPKKFPGFGSGAPVYADPGPGYSSPGFGAAPSPIVAADPWGAPKSPGNPMLEQNQGPNVEATGLFGVSQMPATLPGLFGVDRRSPNMTPQQWVAGMSPDQLDNITRMAASLPNFDGFNNEVRSRFEYLLNPGMVSASPVYPVR